MSGSDWLAVTLAVVGLCGAFWISWSFFRTQQRTDFGKLTDVLHDLRARVVRNAGEEAEALSPLLKQMKVIEVKLEHLAAGVYSNAEFSDKISLVERLTEISERLNGLKSQMDDSFAQVLYELRENQESALEATQVQFSRHADEARSILETAITRELAKHMQSPTETNAVTQSLVSLVRDALLTMGKFQRESIHALSDRVFVEFENRIAGAVQEIQSDVNDLEARVSSSLFALPSATERRADEGGAHQPR